MVAILADAFYISNSNSFIVVQIKILHNKHSIDFDEYFCSAYKCAGKITKKTTCMTRGRRSFIGHKSSLSASRAM